MANNKENDSSASGDGSPDPSPRSKLANSTEALNLSDPFDESDDQEDTVYYDLDDVVSGGCSTCASGEHATVDCDRKDETPAELMMSGALQSDVEGSAQGAATGTSTALPAVKSAEAEDTTQPGQRAGRRNSV